MRRALPWIAGLAVVAALAIGIAQAGGGSEEAGSPKGPPVAERRLTHQGRHRSGADPERDIKRPAGA